jgi:uncharacterized protein
MAHPNAERFLAGYQAFMTGDMEALRREYLTGDVVWHAFGDGALSGDFHGADDVIALFGRTFEMSGGTFRVEVHDALANDEHAVVLGTVTADRAGKRLHQRYTHVAHMRDGKLSESWIFSEDQAAVDSFWS